MKLFPRKQITATQHAHAWPGIAQLYLPVTGWLVKQLNDFTDKHLNLKDEKTFDKYDIWNMSFVLCQLPHCKTQLFEHFSIFSNWKDINYVSNKLEHVFNPKWSLIFCNMVKRARYGVWLKLVLPPLHWLSQSVIFSAFHFSRCVHLSITAVHQHSK